MIPAGRRRLAREPITGDRRDHDVEGVLRAASEGRGVGEWADELDLLEDRPGPPVRDDDGQRALVLRTHVDEVDVEPVDLGDELGQGVELRLALAPVVVRRPVAREFLERRERHTLRRVRDGLLLRPSRGLNAPPHIGLFRFRNFHSKRSNSGLVTACLLCRFIHSFAPSEKEKRRARSNRCRCGRDHTGERRSAVLHRGVGRGPGSPGLFTCD